MLHRNSYRVKFSFLALAMLIAAAVSGQTIKVLPGNGKFSPSAAPQGATRAQRQFYLIDSAELARSGLTSTTILNSIGFTIAARQDRTTRGKFNVYLQNTPDAVSRVDTGWTSAKVVGNSLTLALLNRGNYEWQVRTTCSAASPFSPSSYFEVDRDTCKAPTRLVTANVTGTGADLQWIKPSTPVDSFKVEYSRIDSVSWTTHYTKNASYHVTGLIPGQSYQWKVSSSCSGAAPKETAIFTTVPEGSCATVSGLSAGVIKDTIASVSWSLASQAIQYEIRYRRAGTTIWDYESSITNTASLLGLLPGTKYEWQVRGVCTATDNGSFADGTPFTTTGAQRCYYPEALYIDSLSGSAAKLSWDTAADATGYEVRYRQLETISWTNAINGMTQVHKDSITIRDTVGSFHIPFKNGSLFTYGGKGLYVAFEYANDSTKLSTSNLALVNYSERSFKNVDGEDSARMIVSMGSPSTDSLPEKLTALPFRPETWFGSSTLRDSAAVIAVYAMGQQAIPYGNPAKVSALVRNFSNSDKTYAVTFSVKNTANTILHTQVVNATVKKDSVLLVSFADWAPAAVGLDSLIVSLPAQAGENVLNNNSLTYLQSVNGSILSYADNSDAVAFAGADTLSGLTLARYKMGSCGAVNSVQVYLGPTAIGHSLRAVIMNASGSILDSSALLVPDSSHVNRYQSFYFTSAVSIPTGTEFYIGLAQPKSLRGLLPVGVQWEGGFPRKGAYYRANLNGSGLKDTLNKGRLMIRAEIVPGTLSPTITGNLVLCPGGSNALSAASISRRFANAIIASSSQGSSEQFTAAQALGAPDVYPAYGFNSNSWMGTSAGREYLVLKFPAEDSINYIDIYQTLNPGAIDTVYVKNPSTGLFESVYAGGVNSSDTIAQVKRVSFNLTSFKVSEVRIALNGAASGGNNAIDAVSIGRIATTSFSSYKWARKSSSGTTPLGTSSTVNATVAGDYTLTVSNSEGCTASYTATVTTPDQTPPSITSSGPLTFCVGDSVTLYSNKKGGNTWSTGATTDAITVKTGGNYSLLYNDHTGCGALTSNTMSVEVNAFPVVKVEGILGICPDASTTLTAIATGPASYTYLWSNGTPVAGNVVRDAGTQSVTATDTVGCATTASVVTFITPKPQPDITGKTNFCPGGATTLSVGGKFSNYSWSTGASSMNISVNAIGKYYVRVKDSFGCFGTDTIIIGQFVPPTPAISGNRSICGSPTTLNAGGGYVSYAWSNGATTQTVLINTPGVANVIVTDYNGCTGTASATTIKDSLPPRPGPITSAQAMICNAPGSTYSINATPEATHYVWFAPEGATIVSGQGSRQVVLAFNPTFISGNLVVASSNACGQSGSLLPRVLPINLVPATPGQIFGSLTGVCSGPRTYSVSPIDGATSYNWKVPAGATITSGKGTAAITVTFATTFAGGSICVQAVNSCGTSNQKCINVIGAPNAPGAITGPATVCSKQTNVAYSVAAVPGTTTYIWTVPNQAAIISGQGTTTILVRFATVGGVITVTAKNACGSSAAVSRPIVVDKCLGSSTVFTAGSKVDFVRSQQLVQEVISPAGSFNKSGAMQLDWTLGEPCIEAMSSSKGMYTQGFHQPVLVVARETKRQSAGLKITAAPNPVSTRLKVTFDGVRVESLVLSVRDAGGKIVYTKTISAADKAVEISMVGLSQGLYILNVQKLDGETVEHFKIVKMN